MDLWIEIKLGRRWIDDDRTIHEDVKVQQELMLTSTKEITHDMKDEFMNASSKAFDRVIDFYNRTKVN